MNPNLSSIQFDSFLLRLEQQPHSHHPQSHTLAHGEGGLRQRLSIPCVHLDLHAPFNDDSWPHGFPELRTDFGNHGTRVGKPLWATLIAHVRNKPLAFHFCRNVILILQFLYAPNGSPFMFAMNFCKQKVVEALPVTVLDLFEWPVCRHNLSERISTWTNQRVPGSYPGKFTKIAQNGLSESCFVFRISIFWVIW